MSKKSIEAFWGFILMLLMFGGPALFTQLSAPRSTQPGPTATPSATREPFDEAKHCASNSGRHLDEYEKIRCKQYDDILLGEWLDERHQDLVDDRLDAQRELNNSRQEGALFDAEMTAEAYTSSNCPYTSTDSNVRSGPGTKYSVQYVANSGSCIPVMGINQQNTWYFFQSQLNSGDWVNSWISASLILNAPKSLTVFGLDGLPLMVTASSNIKPAPVAPSIGCPGGCSYQKQGCNIKGNVAYETGERIYHVPGQEYYSETVINPQYDERWFCSQQEALDAGWRRSHK